MLNDAVNWRFCSKMLHVGTTLTKFMKIQYIQKTGNSKNYFSKSQNMKDTLSKTLWKQYMTVQIISLKTRGWLKK